MKFSFRKPFANFSSVLVRAALGMLVLCASAHATSLFQVTVDTSSLGSLPGSAPYALDFQFNNGSILNNNTVTVNNFLYNGGGAPFGAANLFGGATGNISSSIFFNNSSPFQEVFQTFTPGTSVRFDVLFTTNSDGATPDLFAFALLDKNSNNIQTSGLGDALVWINVNGPGAFAQGGSGIGDFSKLTAATAAVPEPATGVLILAGLPLLGFVARRKMN